MNRSRFSLLISLILFLPTLLAAQRTVEGCVVDMSGQPIAGALIKFAGIDLMLVTASDGSFTIGPLPDSVRIVIASDSGYAPRAAWIPAGEDSQIRLVMQPSSRFVSDRRVLWGKVLNDDGRPIIGAAIRVPGTKLGAISKSPDGAFFIENLPIENLQLVVSAVGCTKVTMEVAADSMKPAPLLFLMAESTEGVRELMNRRFSYFDIVRGQPGTIRSIFGDDINRSARPTLFGSASP